jgi:hypothetical protein
MELFIVVFWVLFIFFIRVLTLFLHELGHSIPAILMSREKVNLYMGSYGAQNNTFHLKIGLLECWFKKDAAWDRGITVPESTNFTIKQRILFTLMGPVVTILCMLGFGYWVYIGGISIEIRVVCAILCLITFLDTLRFLVPSRLPIKMTHDEIIYNDGQLLRNLLKQKRLSAKLKEVNIALDHKDYEGAGDLLLEMIKKSRHKAYYYRYAVNCYSQTKQLEKIATTYVGFEKTGEMNANEYVDAGLISAYLYHYETALRYFEKALDLQADHFNALTNIAFCHLVLEHYATALSFFDDLVQNNPENAYLVANKGLASFKSGQAEGGLKEMEKALEINPEEPYVYRSLGIYYLDQSDSVSALKYFHKAKALNPETHIIDALIAQAEAISSDKT